MKLIPDRLRRRSEPNPDGTMTLVDHLSELRHRLIVSIVAIAVGGVIGWFLFDPVIDLLRNPYCDYWRTVPPGLRATRDCALFFSERFWREHFDRPPPGLLGAGSGVAVGEYYLGPRDEMVAVQGPASVAYTRKDFTGSWEFFPEDGA